MNKITKRILTALICISLLLPASSAYASHWPAASAIQAEGGIVIDAESGALLYGQNIHTPYYPASITKILTALIVIENCDLDESFTFSHNAVYNVETGSSSAGYDEGDTITVRDALYAMLLKSANEVANGLAEHCSGSIEEFAKLMNQKAAELGCTDSHFANPSGLNDEEHYTSAYDFALISRAAFANPTLVEIDSALYYDLPPSKTAPEGQTVYAHHAMIKKNSSKYYEGAVCGKTGYTSLAGNTLVTYAKRDSMSLITVILNGHQTHYTDTAALLNFGFSNFRDIPLSELDSEYSDVLNNTRLISKEDEAGLRLDKSSHITVPKNADMSKLESSVSFEPDAAAPANAVGAVVYSYEGRNIGSSYILSGNQNLTGTGNSVDNSPAGISSEAVLNQSSKTGNPATEEAPANVSASDDSRLPDPASGNKGTDKAFSFSDILKYLPVILAVTVLLALLLSAVVFIKRKIAEREERELFELRERRRQRRAASGWEKGETPAPDLSFVRDRRSRKRKKFLWW